MTGGEIRTARQARTLLQLAEGASLDEVRRAYRAAVRSAHPDRGGDADALRRVIDAHRLLTNLHAARQHLAPVRATPPPAPKPLALTITLAEAVAGGPTTVPLPQGGHVRATLPKGLRPGDRLRLRTRSGPLLFRVRIDAHEVEIRGDHLWLTVRIAPDALDTGTKVEVETGHGLRSVWISAEAAQRGLARLVGQGLPARGDHAQGHMFLRLELDPAMAQRAPEGRSRTLLRRFTAAWAA